MFSYVFLLFLKLCLTAPVDDPSQWPGHLQAFGEQQKTVNIDIVYQWPTPNDFFRHHVDKMYPVLFKGVYKNTNAVKRWHDDSYLAGRGVSEEVYLEPFLKENRTVYAEKTTFEKFVKRYHGLEKVLFYTLPKHLMKDVYLPPPLTCNETSDYLINANIHMSRGGSKSVVCNEDVETIFCAVQGTYKFHLIEYTQNKNYVVDRQEGGYSTVDVDRVDYTKYPDLRKVDQYIKAELHEGDCVYIPYKWYKQMNGYANRYNRNIGLNFWFNHLHDHKPTTCELNENQATIDKFRFSDVANRIAEDVRREKERNNNATLGNNTAGWHEETIDPEFELYGPELERGDQFISHFYNYLSYTKKGQMSFKSFYTLIKRDESLTRVSHKDIKFPKSFAVLAYELFKELDVNNDTKVSDQDFQEFFSTQKKTNRLSLYLDHQVARIEDYVEDLMEAKHHDEPMHLFEERMLEKFRNWRKFEL